MKLRQMESRLKLALDVALVGSIIVVGTLVLQLGASFGDVALAQNPDPQPTGSIQGIDASTPNLILTTGNTIVLSISVIERQDVEVQQLSSDFKFDWSASGGYLPNDADGASVSYTAPSDPGTYTVTASPRTGCAGTASECTATFTIVVRQQVETARPDVPPRNPEGEIPAVIIDSEGGQYEVLTPEEGGAFTGENFSISAEMGSVPNGEFVAVQMAECESASNAGMSHHRYTLSGNEYDIFVIDSEGAPISSYKLNRAATVCVPVPDELRAHISSVELVKKNSDGTLTVLTSSLQIGESLTLCGYTSTLPATVAVGIPGTPPPALPEPEPEVPETLPRTGGTAPTSLMIVAWVLLGGVALIAIGTFATTYRRSGNARQTYKAH